jgi:hypothetical protein
MKKYAIIIAGALVALLVILYFAHIGPFKAPDAKPARVRGTTEAEPVRSAQEKSMDAVAASPSEKPAPKEEAPEQAATEAPTVEIPKDKQQLIGVRTTSALVVPLAKNIRTVGLVEYDQRRLNTINTKLEGWVEKLYVNFTGTYVRKGDPIADIYSPELWATQMEFINMVRGPGPGLKTGRKAGAARMISMSPR